MSWASIRMKLIPFRNRMRRARLLMVRLVAIVIKMDTKMVVREGHKQLVAVKVE